ncbi:MAG: hypothetical protein SFX74_02910 [Fimbriimonadaceae bacterium]|nr:hypothetical protein [Fimbriimonadaceae bacterium]
MTDRKSQIVSLAMGVFLGTGAVLLLGPPGLPRAVVLGLMVVMSIAFLVGAVIGFQSLIRRR